MASAVVPPTSSVSATGASKATIVPNPSAKCHVVRMSIATSKGPSQYVSARRGGLVPTVQSSNARMTAMAMECVRRETASVPLAMGETPVLLSCVPKTAVAMECARMEYASVSKASSAPTARRRHALRTV